MPGLWRNDPKTPEGKYLVKRRDGTIPAWPWFVLGAADPAAPVALKAYADEARRLGFDPQYVNDLYNLAAEFSSYGKDVSNGDPDAPRHRVDDPATVAEMAKGRGA
jgi:hypothetical protein